MDDPVGDATSGTVAEAWRRTGREAWPTIAEPAGVEAYVAARLPPDLAPEDAATRVSIADLYLACACAQADPRAIALVERELFPAIVPAIRQIRAEETFVEDVLQTMRATLFVPGPGMPPKIAGYAGRGPLRSWLRAVGVKQAISALRARGLVEGRDDGQLAVLADAADDPELQALKHQYRAAFKRAFEAAVAALPDRDRALVKQHHLDGLTIDRLGALYQVDRATAARWLVAARATLFKITRKELVRELGLAGDELASIVRLVQSQIELSLHRLLT